MIKWEHSVFALPFALSGAMLAAGGLPAWHQLAWIIVAMVAARSAAMSFNRLADASLDAANPPHRQSRSAGRPADAGFVTTFVLVACGIFVLAASQLNRLDPYALARRAGGGAALFVRQAGHALVAFLPRPRAGHRAGGGMDCSARTRSIRGFCSLTVAVTFWVGGFDVIYACQDYEFDRNHGLHSIPRHLRDPQAHCWRARLLHVAMLGLLVVLVVVFGLGKLAVGGSDRGGRACWPTSTRWCGTTI